MAAAHGLESLPEAPRSLIAAGEVAVGFGVQRVEAEGLCVGLDGLVVAPSRTECVSEVVVGHGLLRRHGQRLEAYLETLFDVPRLDQGYPQVAPMHPDRRSKAAGFTHLRECLLHLSRPEQRAPSCAWNFASWGPRRTASRCSRIASSSRPGVSIRRLPSWRGRWVCGVTCGSPCGTRLRPRRGAQVTSARCPDCCMNRRSPDRGGWPRDAPPRLPRTARGLVRVALDSCGLPAYVGFSSMASSSTASASCG